MARLRISEAARVAGVSRVTLHRHIRAGKLSRSADGTLDTAELVRAGFVLHPETLPPDTPVTPRQPPATLPATPPVPPPVAPDTALYERLIARLQQELDAAHAREQAARERETTLLQMLQHLQQQQERVLEGGRGPAPAAPSSPPRTFQAASEPRGALRQRILTLLQEYPAGLSPAQVRLTLTVAKPLTNTMRAMWRDGLLVRVAVGRFALPTRHEP